MQAEIRVLSYYSQDEELKKIYTEDSDLHDQTAKEVINNGGDDWTKEDRGKAKAINFGY